MEWILIIWMMHPGNYNYNPTYIPGFVDRKECVAAGTEAARGVTRMGNIEYRCVKRTKT